MPADLTVQLLGEFQIRHGDRLLTDAFTARLQSFFAYLLLNRDKALSRQQLAYHFWPDSTDAQARANLRKLVYRLRHAFPEIDNYLDVDGVAVKWRDEAPVWLDAAQFETRLREGEAAGVQQQPALLSEAIALYTGDLLPDHYDEWVLQWRERLRLRYLEALDLLAALQEAKRAYPVATETVRRLLREDPLRESGYRRLMRLQALSGDVPGALGTYHRCVTLLEQELGVEPGAATRQVYRQLMDRQLAPAQMVAVAAPRQVPLTGRDTAWRILVQAWREVVAGATQAVFVSGEAGIGKTRLAEELLLWAGRQGIIGLRSACFAVQEQLPLGPVADLLRSEPARQILSGLAPRWRVEVARILPELLAADPELEQPAPMTESWQQQHLFRALLEAVTAVGDPLLLFVDDIHWADADTRGWLHYLAQQRGAFRFLLLATVRSEEMTPDHPLPMWQEAVARVLPVQHLRLPRLDAPATAALAAHLRGHPLTNEESAALYAETEGNPLFTVEMVRAGLQQGQMRLPEKMRSAIELHLDSLSRQAQDVIGLAAIIGRDFTFPLIAAASPLAEEELLDSLDELWQRQVIREQGEEAYDFSHDKIRQVALDRLSPARRRWWHRRVAEGLQRVHAPDLDGVHGQIAVHWEAGGERQAAVAHYLLAAQRAAYLYAHEERVRQLQQALALLPVGQTERIDVQAQLGEAFLLLGRYDAAAAAFGQAAAESVDDSQKVSLLGRRVLAFSGAARHEEAAATYREGLILLEERPAAAWETEAWQIWLDLHLSLLDSLYFTGKAERMEEVCQEMAGPLEAHGTARQRAEYFAFLVRTRYRAYRYRITEEEVALSRSALKWARQAGDENQIHFLHFGVGFSLLWASRTAEAIDEMQMVLAQAEARGNVPLQSRCLAYLTVAYRFQGAEAQVREAVDNLLPVARAEGNSHYLGVVAAQRAWLAWRAGDKAAATAHALSALAQWQKTNGLYPMQWLARFPLLELALDKAPAPAALVEAQEHAGALLVPVQHRLPASLTAALEAGLAEHSAGARAHLREACRLAEEYGYL